MIVTGGIAAAAVISLIVTLTRLPAAFRGERVALWMSCVLCLTCCLASAKAPCSCLTWCSQDRVLACMFVPLLPCMACCRGMVPCQETLCVSALPRLQPHPPWAGAAGGEGAPALQATLQNVAINGFGIAATSFLLNRDLQGRERDRVVVAREELLARLQASSVSGTMVCMTLSMCMPQLLLRCRSRSSCASAGTELPRGMSLCMQALHARWQRQSSQLTVMQH